MKWHYRKSRAPTAVSMQSICARVHWFAIRSIYNTHTFNKISSKAKAIRQRSTEENFMEMSLPQHEDLIPDVNSHPPACSASTRSHARRHCCTTPCRGGCPSIDYRKILWIYTVPQYLNKLTCVDVDHDSQKSGSTFLVSNISNREQYCTLSKALVASRKNTKYRAAIVYIIWIHLFQNHWAHCRRSLGFETELRITRA